MGGAPKDQPATDAASELDEAVTALIVSLQRPGPIELHPRLERFLRGVIHARAVSFRRQTQSRALGIDAEDITQRIFEKLFERPPDLSEADSKLARLVAWVATVTQHHLLDLAKKKAEFLPNTHDSGRPPPRYGGSAAVSSPTPSHTIEGQLDAERMIEQARRLLTARYPLAVPLFELLLQNPHLTSDEMASQLGKTSANVEQMRARLRRVLRAHLLTSEPAGRTRK